MELELVHYLFIASWLGSILVSLGKLWTHKELRTWIVEILGSKAFEAFVWLWFIVVISRYLCNTVFQLCLLAYIAVIAVSFESSVRKWRATPEAAINQYGSVLTRLGMWYTVSLLLYFEYYLVVRHRSVWIMNSLMLILPLAVEVLRYRQGLISRFFGKPT